MLPANYVPWTPWTTGVIPPVLTLGKLSLGSWFWESGDSLSVGLLFPLQMLLHSPGLGVVLTSGTFLLSHYIWGSCLPVVLVSSIVTASQHQPKYVLLFKFPVPKPSVHYFKLHLSFRSWAKQSHVFVQKIL